MPIATILPRRSAVRAAAHAVRSLVESKAVGVLLLLVLLAAVVLAMRGPHVITPPEDIARATAKKYAYEAYVQWSMRTGRHCPSDLVDLNEYMHNRDTEDPWGREYAMRCRRPTLQRRSFGIVVVSAGPDRRFGTGDDIRSSH